MRACERRESRRARASDGWREGEPRRRHMITCNARIRTAGAQSRSPSSLRAMAAGLVLVVEQTRHVRAIESFRERARLLRKQLFPAFNCATVQKSRQPYDKSIIHLGFIAARRTHTHASAFTQSTPSSQLRALDRAASGGSVGKKRAHTNELVIVFIDLFTQQQQQHTRESYLE